MDSNSLWTFDYQLITCKISRVSVFAYQDSINTLQHLGIFHSISRHHFNTLSARTMIVNGKYHYICIVPREWSVFDLEDLEVLIFKSMRDHFCENGQIKGAVTSIERTTTKTEYWNLKLWLKKVSDRRPHPDSKTYFWMLMDWRPNPEEFSAMCLTHLCYFPMEWRSYSTLYLRRLVFEAAGKQWKACKHIEGTTILLGGVTAKLQYHHFDIWLRKDGNLENFPRKEKYFRLRTKCIVCATAL